MANAYRIEFRAPKGFPDSVYIQADSMTEAVALAGECVPLDATITEIALRGPMATPRVAALAAATGGER